MPAKKKLNSFTSSDKKYPEVELPNWLIYEEEEEEE